MFEKQIIFSQMKSVLNMFCIEVIITIKQRELAIGIWGC